MRIVIRGAYVVTMDSGGRELEDGWVSISGRFVEDLGGGEPPEAEKEVCLGGRVLTPALINTLNATFDHLFPSREEHRLLLR